MQNLIIVDCGKNSSTLLKKGKIYTFPHNKLLDEIVLLPKGTRVVSEEAHLGTPRRSLSKSQPYTDEELLDFYKKCKEKGIDLKFFPQQSTFRAQQYYRTKYNLSEQDFPKSDENDPKALYELLHDFPDISLSFPKDNFEPSPVREDGKNFTDKVSKHLNYARASEPKPYDDEDDGCRLWINENIEQIATKLSLTTREVFGLTDESRYKRTNKLNLNKIKMTQLYSVVATLIDFEGKCRKRGGTQEVPGWKFIKKYVIRMTPFHRRGGVARSNLYHHGMKHWFKNQCEKEGVDTPSNGGRGVFTDKQEKVFKTSRIAYSNAIRELFQTCRNIILDK